MSLSTTLTGNCTPNKKSACSCFVLYLKIINTFFKNNICILKQIVQETKIKNGIEILVGQVVLSYGP